MESLLSRCAHSNLLCLSSWIFLLHLKMLIALGHVLSANSITACNQLKRFFVWNWLQLIVFNWNMTPVYADWQRWQQLWLTGFVALLMSGFIDWPSLTCDSYCWERYVFTKNHHHYQPWTFKWGSKAQPVVTALIATSTSSIYFGGLADIGWT